MIGDSTPMEMENVYRTYKPLLFAVAYRMLGTATDAEDLVQELFASLQESDLDRIGHLKAYLVKMAVNRCLNFLKSARRTREVYTGPWLPEPLLTLPADQDPAERVVREEAVSYAFLVLLERLTPMERAVFVLREALGYAYGEVAEMLNKTEANCRKIYSRAKLKIRLDEEALPERPGDTEHLVQSFLSGVRTGDFAEFVRLLTEDAVLISDGGGKRRAALKPICGRQRIYAFFTGIVRKGSLRGVWLPTVINGQQGLVLVQERRPVKVVCFAVDRERQQAGSVFMVLNPDKLRHISSELNRHKSAPGFV
jgi:RNA polymerase sigma-70 factor (ECF subfamily)